MMSERSQKQKSTYCRIPLILRTVQEQANKSMVILCKGIIANKVKFQAKK